MHRSDFLKLLKQDFPQLTKEINKQEGLLHYEMNVFHQFAQKLILDKDVDRIKKAFRLADICYANGNKALKNAIDVSFLEGLKLKNHNWAWEIFPESLKKYI